VVAIAYLILDGVTAVVFGLTLPPRTGGAWVLMSGVASVVLGILVWREWPLAGDQAIGVLIGIKLALEGAVLIGVAFALGGAVSKLVGAAAQDPPESA